MDENIADPPSFGGKPGEPVAEVDPDDLKAVWKEACDLQARHPGQQVATGLGVLQSICKPGADIQAVFYRASLLSLMTYFAPEQLASLRKDGQFDEAVFRAAAKVPMEWIGARIVRQGPPLNMDEFLRLCGQTGDPQ